MLETSIYMRESIVYLRPQTEKNKIIERERESEAQRKKRGGVENVPYVRCCETRRGVAIGRSGFRRGGKGGGSNAMEAKRRTMRIVACLEEVLKKQVRMQKMQRLSSELEDRGWGRRRMESEGWRMRRRGEKKMVYASGSSSAGRSCLLISATTASAFTGISLLSNSRDWPRAGSLDLSGNEG